jgi:hypothetical protein
VPILGRTSAAQTGPLLIHSMTCKSASWEVEMAVSDQLTKLAARAKEAEDRAAAGEVEQFEVLLVLLLNHLPLLRLHSGE